VDWGRRSAASFWNRASTSDIIRVCGDRMGRAFRFLTPADHNRRLVLAGLRIGSAAPAPEALGRSGTWSPRLTGRRVFMVASVRFLALTTVLSSLLVLGAVASARGDEDRPLA
jgi:hypothetical protein